MDKVQYQDTKRASSSSSAATADQMRASRAAGKQDDLFEKSYEQKTPWRILDNTTTSTNTNETPNNRPSAAPHQQA